MFSLMCSEKLSVLRGSSAFTLKWQKDKNLAQQWNFFYNYVLNNNRQLSNPKFSILTIARSLWHFRKFDKISSLKFWRQKYLVHLKVEKLEHDTTVIELAIKTNCASLWPIFSMDSNDLLSNSVLAREHFSVVCKGLSLNFRI